MIDCSKLKMSRKMLNCLGVALLTSSLAFVVVVVQARPTFRQQQVIEDDPLMALPSDQHAPQEVQYVTSYQQMVAPRYHQGADQRQEVVVEYQAQAQEQQQQQQHQHQHQHQQQPQYIYRQEQPSSPYQLIQVSAQPQEQHQQQQQQSSPNDVHVHVAGGPDCHQRHEYTSILSLENSSGQQVVGEQQQAQYVLASDIKSERPRGEYPGEIIYVGQNNQGQQQLAGLQNVASSLAHNSDVSATILTEIPIKDMPYEVLSKLKREYGVKVVATRDRPGANLVINCDDYPNQEGSVCGRQAPQQQQTHHAEHRQQQQQQQQQQQPHVTYLTDAEPIAEHPVELPAEHHHHSTTFNIDHEVQPTSEPANVYVGEHEPSQGQNEHPALTELAYPQPSAESHEPTTSGAAEDQQPNNESTNYGTRTHVAVGGGEQPSGVEVHETTHAAPVEANHQENSSATSDQYQPGASPEAVDQHTGFDEQPKSNDP